MNAFTQNRYSDQSISDEEDGDCVENCVSLGAPSETKEALQIQLQLEMLRGNHEPNHGSKSASLSNEEQNRFSHEDGAKEFITCNLDEEIISDDEYTEKFSVISRSKEFRNDNFSSFGSEKSCGSYLWSKVTEEAGELNCLHENGKRSSSFAVSFKPNILCKGGRGKVKPKFAFSFQSNKKEKSCSSVSMDEEELSPEVLHVSEAEGSKPMTLRTLEHSMAERLEDFQGVTTVKFEPSEVAGESMTDLLDNDKNRNNVLRNRTKNYPTARGKREHTPLLGNRKIDGEDPVEHLECGTSSDDEIRNQVVKPAALEMRRHTMADQFVEVLDAARANNEGPFLVEPTISGFGLFGRLRQVMQNEKEVERDFFRKLPANAACLDEASCLDVEILSKYLDAKLSVCQCILVKEQKEGSKTQEGTIIFNSRACNDVDLDVGNLIRIHPPWKEVMVVGIDECIILCTYFSQIFT